MFSQLGSGETEFQRLEIWNGTAQPNRSLLDLAIFALSWRSVAAWFLASNSSRCSQPEPSCVWSNQDGPVSLSLAQASGAQVSVHASSLLGLCHPFSVRIPSPLLFSAVPTHCPGTFWHLPFPTALGSHILTVHCTSQCVERFHNCYLIPSPQ